MCTCMRGERARGSRCFRYFRVVKRERLFGIKGTESLSPCVVLLKALQLVPLLSQRGLQIQIGSIVGQLKCTVIKLRDGRNKIYKVKVIKEIQQTCHSAHRDDPLGFLCLASLYYVYP